MDGADERRADDGLRDRLQEIEDGYKARAARIEKRISLLTKWTFIILAIMATAELVFGGLSVYLVSQNSKRQTDNLARQADINRTQADLKRTVAAIQQQRIESIWDTCRSQDYRHDKTLSRLNGLVNGIKDPAEKVRAEANIEGTKSIIEALAPHQDCTANLRLRFGFSEVKAKRVVRQLRRDLGPPGP